MIYRGLWLLFINIKIIIIIIVLIIKRKSNKSLTKILLCVWKFQKRKHNIKYNVITNNTNKSIAEKKDFFVDVFYEFIYTMGWYLYRTYINRYII
jgi:hypothetical protein